MTLTPPDPVLSIHKLPASGATDISFPMKGWRATGDWAKVPEDRVTVSKSVFSTGLPGEDVCTGDCSWCPGVHVGRGSDPPGHTCPRRPHGSAGAALCCLAEADASSVFVVGTVLYRNLGSFLALQRWAQGLAGHGE